MRTEGFNGMDVVDKDEVLNFPGCCIFTGDSEGPFLDTNSYVNARELDGVDPYGYVSVAKVRDMGRAIGMVERERIEELQADVAAYGEKVREMQRQLDAYTTVKDAEKVLVGA